MSDRNTQYKFVSTDPDEIVAELTSIYESITGRTVHQASPEKLFIQWVANSFVLLYAQINYIGNQNIPSRASGENLDHLAELFFMHTRPQAVAATTVFRFTISEAQETAILIPEGTQVTTPDWEPVFETTEDAYVNPGETTVDVPAVCQTLGSAGNGYAAGTLNELVDVFTYYESVENLSTTAGGIDMATDDEFYDLLVASEDAYSTAGPKGAYEYLAKSVSMQIKDVVVNSPEAGKVKIYSLMDDGTAAGEQVKELIMAKCSAEDVRPLTDLVSVDDPNEVSYDVDMTYYVSRDSTKKMADIQADVTKAVSDYVAWQCERFGRDINPSKLIQMVVEAGAKRAVVRSPVFTPIYDGKSGNPPHAPDLATIGEITIINGGYEE